jgi:heme/copper-type cytochrome/quinol oxidase subunit 3
MSALTLAVVLLSGAAGFGVWLAMPHLGDTARRPGWRTGLVHGGLGAAGLALLLAGFGAAAPNAGAANFRLDAAVLLTATLLLGLAFALLRWRRGRAPGLLLALHVILACFGCALALTYVAIG